MVAIKFTALLSALAVVSAAPTEILQSRASSPFTGTDGHNFIAIRSGSPIHFGPLNAAGGKIWIAFQYDSDGKVDMDSVIPQTLYVDGSTGALSYTKALKVGKSSAAPKSAVSWGFRWSEVTPGSNKDAYLTSTQGAFLACPTKKGSLVYQVFVDLGGKIAKCRKDCLSFVAKGAAIQSGKHISVEKYL
ncbi:hypothetical protein ABW20_dc0106666 [Dactylellina cionopaga]|nr:hypothetical protein ABW20_dc0106666 [Dactylellina cionopaga]